MENFVAAHGATGKPSNVNASDQDHLQGLLSTLSLLYMRPNTTYVNPVQTDNPITIIEGLKLVAGVTGILMCVALSLLVSTSSEYMRRSFYNIFWYVHQGLAVVFFVLFIIHGVQGIIRHQTNLDRNNPMQCYLLYSDWSSEPTRQCDIPQFAGTMPKSWIWVIVSIVIYLTERIVRIVRGFKQFEIVKFYKHPSNVLELQIDNLRMKYVAGQYIYLNCR